jgi:hypothetical protein
MPFFYVKNNNFIALFNYSDKGEPIASLHPSKNLTDLIKTSNIYFMLNVIIEPI